VLPPAEEGGWKKREGAADEVDGADEAVVLEVFWPRPPNNGF
jgi:hypothetical protein